jgi:ArsR family transcriptional regulator
MNSEIKCCEGTSLKNFPPDDRIKKGSEYLKAISDPARIKIILSLEKEDRCVCEIEEILKMSQTVASHHLKILKVAGIISDSKSGKWVYYSLKDKKAVKLLKILFS